MAFASISGLVSGLDTATIIDQLMQVEANPQTLLKNKMSAQEKAVAALQALNTKLADLAAKAGQLTETGSWTQLRATSSSEHVAVSAGSGAAPGTFTFTVVETARRHQLSFAQSAAGSDRVTAAGSTVVRLDRLDGTTIDIETGDGTLDGLVRGINSSDAGVRATKVRLDDGTNRLRMESIATGEQEDFTLTNADGSAILGGASVTAGRDAAVTIGTDTVHSTTNTFIGVLEGIDFTIAAGTPASTVVDVTVTRDAEAVAESVNALVDAANAALTEIDTLAGYDTTRNQGGLLTGDATLRALRNALLATVTTAVDGSSMVGVGIELDRSGRISLDEETFAAAYAADPDGVTAKFASSASWAGSGQVTMIGSSWRTTPGAHTVDSTAGTIDGEPATVSGSVLTGAVGTSAEGLSVAVTGGASGTLTYQPGFAGRLAAVAERASDSQVGTVTAAIKSRSSSVDDMEEAIESWDVRLELRRQTLTRQFSAMEVMLGQLQNQSSWLAGQIGSLPQISSD